MLTKSVKSVISVVLQHVARAKEIRAIGAIREHNIRMVSPDGNITQNTQKRLTPTLHLLQKGVSLSLEKAIPNTAVRYWGVAYNLLLLAMNFVRHGQLFATLSATRCQYATAVGCLHTLTETMLVISLSVVGLECSFHFCYAVFLFLIYISLHEKGQHYHVTDLAASRSF